MSPSACFQQCVKGSLHVPQCKPCLIQVLRAVPGSRPETAGSNLSLAPVLRQGLRSKDSSALDQTLLLKDRDMMDTSVLELSSTEAFDLLQECAKRLLEKPLEGQVYCAWIQRVVFHHGMFIRSHPALRDALRPLHDATSSRCASYRGLMYMHGRLHGLVARGTEVLEREATETVVRVPLLEYVEGDEDLEEDEKQKQEEEVGEVEDDEDDEDLDFNADDWLESDD
ncbi:Wdr43 [Symbiodinium natans]|uniref:Wdr43 protein n=1 Tax=Symbiodinium natans TaxID=878477 RepID=A0A812P8M9_9DINO|nr:Wdr43 [Symbiodinium natans]